MKQPQNLQVNWHNSLYNKRHQIHLFISSEQETSRVPHAAKDTIRKDSGTHGRCSRSPSKMSWSSRRWSSPTVGCTRPCWRTSPLGRWCLGLGKRQQRGEGQRGTTGKKKKERMTAVKYVTLTMQRQHADRRNATALTIYGGRIGAKQWHREKLNAD